MSLAEELLEHARFLANLDERTTTQANIRRAVSAAYYAVFHLLSAAIAKQISPSNPPGLRGRTQRALNHAEMYRAADLFKNPGGPVTRVARRYWAFRSYLVEAGENCGRL